MSDSATEEKQKTANELARAAKAQVIRPQRLGGIQDWVGALHLAAEYIAQLKTDLDEALEAMDEAREMAHKLGESSDFGWSVPTFEQWIDKWHEETASHIRQSLHEEEET